MAARTVPTGRTLVLDRDAVKKLVRYGKLQALARAWLEAEKRKAAERRRARATATKQALLPLPSDELRPQDTVACRLPKTTLPVYACLTRRSRVASSGAGKDSPR